MVTISDLVDFGPAGLGVFNRKEKDNKGRNSQLVQEFNEENVMIFGHVGH